MKAITQDFIKALRSKKHTQPKKTISRLVMTEVEMENIRSSLFVESSNYRFKKMPIKVRLLDIKRKAYEPINYTYDLSSARKKNSATTSWNAFVFCTLALAVLLDVSCHKSYFSRKTYTKIAAPRSGGFITAVYLQKKSE